MLKSNVKLDVFYLGLMFVDKKFLVKNPLD